MRSSSTGCQAGRRGRSLTKTWGLAGLRVGYLLACPGLVRGLTAAQPLWAVSTPALAACVATASSSALREAEEWAPPSDDLASSADRVLKLVASHQFAPWRTT